MERKLHKIDAADKIAGRLASKIAFLLQGKNKVTYQAHTDCGDSVEIENVAKMKFSGKKLEDKVYHRVTGYPGGLRTTKLSDLMENDPAEALRKMVYNMLPVNKLRPKMIKRLIIK
ncbi:50S ribosomal protein L13 [Candidatus Nomurabacteria bacterium]|nr:50S ribosomal protein L13 [Candidatus Nomurabacteria bacterium]